MCIIICLLLTYLLQMQCSVYAIYKMINVVLMEILEHRRWPTGSVVCACVRPVVCHRCSGTSVRFGLLPEPWCSLCRRQRNCDSSWQYLYRFCKLVMRFYKQEVKFLKMCALGGGEYGGRRLYRYECLLAREGLAVRYASCWTSGLRTIQ